MKVPQNVSDLADQTKNNLKFDKSVKGCDFEGEVTIDTILNSFENTGFQALNLHKAIQEIKRMREINAKIYFGCTSNIISSGLRETVKFLAKNKFIDVFVCTAGGIEEDIIKCFKDTYCASFSENGKELRENGWNRIGNLVINNENYCDFEKWTTEFLNELVEGKTPESPLILTPSKLINLLGKKINNENSVLHWCYKNNIPVYSPAVTDGSLGDMITMFDKRSSLKIDIAEDIYNINMECFTGRENGAIIVGAGLIKHHIFNANLFNNGLDYCVLLNTANEFDGSDSGASISEAYSWGKVKPDRTCVKIHGEASIILPLMVYGAFYKK